MKRIAVLGSTGSIGTSCLDVVDAHRDRFDVVGIAAHRSADLLGEQSRRVEPKWAVLGDASLADSVERSRFAEQTDLRFGPDEIERMAAADEVDIVVAAIVGAAGLRGTWAALETGKRVALANKETLVVAGPLTSELAKKTGAEVIPVDSEHSAVFQAMLAGGRQEVKRVTLTASGGPFRGWTRDRLNDVTVEMALDHPTWKMGPKITIDSATMMNKALEVIEARWLFDLEPDRIDVVVHPQSIVHSMVEFVDGSVIAQLSPPDMKLPIQYALTYPERLDGVSPRMDWTTATTLDFSPPDFEAFPALELGFEVARRGGTAGAVLNAANEVAVERFLADDLKFADIPRACRAVLEVHDYDSSPTLSQLLEVDRWARKETRQWTC